MVLHTKTLVTMVSFKGYCKTNGFFNVSVRIEVGSQNVIIFSVFFSSLYTVVAKSDVQLWTVDTSDIIIFIKDADVFVVHTEA